jgi:transposase-like protein
VPPSPAATLLNDSQRRHLGVTLSQIQRLLHEVLALLTSGTPTGGLVADAHDIPAEFTRRAPALVAEIDAQIAALANRFDLPRREQSRYRWVRAVLGTSIDHLEDTRAVSLRAYGEVHPGLAAALDPDLRVLQERLRGLLATLQWGTNP